MIDADFIHAHWPERLMTAWEDALFCTCGAEFRSSTERVEELWSAHVASEVNARLRLVAK